MVGNGYGTFLGLHWPGTYPNSAVTGMMDVPVVCMTSLPADLLFNCGGISRTRTTPPLKHRQTAKT